MTRVVCCYSTDTASECDDAAAREQELAELLPPAEARGSGGGGSDDDDVNVARSTSSSSSSDGPGYAHEYDTADESEGEEAQRAHESATGGGPGGGGALMRPVPPPAEAAHAAYTSPVRRRMRAQLADARHGAELSLRCLCVLDCKAQEIVRRLRERPARRPKVRAQSSLHTPQRTAAAGYVRI